MLKQLIKDLSAQQTGLKKARKTGSKPGPEAILASNNAAAQVRRNAIRITAALNLYHEMRGSSYTHQIRAGTHYWYKKDYEALKEKLDASKTFQS